MTKNGRKKHENAKVILIFTWITWMFPNSSFSYFYFLFFIVLLSSYIYFLSNSTTSEFE